MIINFILFFPEKKMTEANGSKSWKANGPICSTNWVFLFYFINLESHWLIGQHYKFQNMCIFDKQLPRVECGSQSTLRPVCDHNAACLVYKTLNLTHHLLFFFYLLKIDVALKITIGSKSKSDISKIQW
jgi:hypothetical protein